MSAGHAKLAAGDRIEDTAAGGTLRAERGIESLLTVLNITITARTSDDMRVLYSFTDAQNQALDALLANGGMLGTPAGDLTITSQDARALLGSAEKVV